MNDESVLGQRERRNGYVPRGHVTIGYSEGGGEAEEKVLVIQKSQTFVCDSCRGILVTFIELFILITSNQLGRAFVAQIGAQLFFRGSGPEDTIIEIHNFKVEYMLDTTFILCLASLY